ncbi:MAG: hypothetical protein DHS20C12_06570 [Pseudohongiella sp.]|nr:MAG: hypothetical protein DHS20C12_06570 [Pseudohongiella sp.]
MEKLSNNCLSALCAALILTLGSSQALPADGQIVIEDLTPSQLRGEIKKIETEFYRVYNESLEDESLAIICYDYLPTGSNIKEEACEPQFVINKRSENANDSQFGINIGLTAQSLQNELSEEYAALTTAMTDLSKESEYFRELNSILGALRDELASR